jgi:hypothetical protein
MRDTSRLRRLALRGLLVVIGLELTLALAGRVSPRVEGLLFSGRASQASPFQDDPVFGLVGRPQHPDHDGRGFRNPAALERARVVVLGDSQTYGTGVTREAAWPAQLGKLVTGEVYSMALPGYGPTQELLQVEQALELQPEVVVATLYTGNDPYDCYTTVYGAGQLDGLRGTDPELASPERRADLERRIAEAFAMIGGPQAGRAERQERGGLRGWLSNHSSLYGLARAVRKAARRKAAPSWKARVERAAGTDGALVPFEGGGVRTIFTPRYRLLPLDPGDICIAEGRRLAIAALLELERRVRAGGSELKVLLIPTKELVHEDLMGSVGTEPSAEHARLVLLERAYRSEVVEALEGAGVQWLDGLPALAAPLAQGLGSYPEHHDGHPNEVGQLALARSVALVVASALNDPPPAGK